MDDVLLSSGPILVCSDRYGRLPAAAAAAAAAGLCRCRRRDLRNQRKPKALRDSTIPVTPNPMPSWAPTDKAALPEGADVFVGEVVGSDEVVAGPDVGDVPVPFPLFA